MRYTRLSNSTTYDAKASSEGRQDSASVGGVAVVSMIAVGEIARVHVQLQIRDHRLGCEVATLQARELLLLPPRARAQPPRVPARVPGAQEPAATMCHGKLRPSAQQRHVCVRVCGSCTYRHGLRALFGALDREATSTRTLGSSTKHRDAAKVALSQSHSGEIKRRYLGLFGGQRL